MKRKIRNQFFNISFVSIFITLIISLVVFYQLFERQVYSDLKAYAGVIGISVSNSETDYEKVFSKFSDTEFRVTVVDMEGEVLYDSDAESSEMDNHIDRPEIKEAFEKGESYSTRSSKTLGKSTFYYAFLVDSGNVMRISREANNVWLLFLSAIPVMLAFACILIILCAIWSDNWTKKLIKPIEAIVPNMNNALINSEYKELEPFVNALKEQHADILKNATMRQEFTANVSHELKTPLTSISGYAELIETGIVSGDEAMRFAGEIRKNSSRLLSLINDIINLSELDSEGVKMQLERIDLYTLAENCVDNLRVNAEKQGIEISATGVSAMINADKGMIEEVLYNLCDNAIRYNNRGGKVFVNVKKASENNVCLMVRDNGIGISKEHQDRIFERFYRVDKSRSKETGGTGLGLAIVKHILSQHGAVISIESEEGKGTCITVTFNGVV